MKIKRAVSLLTLEKIKDIDYLFYLLNKNNINYIELPITLLFKNFKYNKRKAYNFLKKLKKHKLSVSSIQSIFYGKNYNILNKKHHSRIISHIEKVCKISKKLNAQNLIFGSPKNRIKNNLTISEADKISIQIFKKITVICKRYKINFCLEPNARIYGCDYINKLSEAYKILKKVNKKNFLINIDTGNISLEENLNLLPKLQNKHIGNFQLSEKNLKKIKIKNKKHYLILKEFNLKNNFVSLEQLNIKKNSVSQEIIKFNKILNRLDDKYKKNNI